MVSTLASDHLPSATTFALHFGWKEGKELNWQQHQLLYISVQEQLQSMR